jgi:hypothetical protein
MVINIQSMQNIRKTSVPAPMYALMELGFTIKRMTEVVQYTSIKESTTRIAEQPYRKPLIIIVLILIALIK